VPPNSRSSDCPECGAGVKVQLDADEDLGFSDLTESEVRQGDYFVCPMCQIAWDSDERSPYEFPTVSPGPDGLLSKPTSGNSLRNEKVSNFRQLGYTDDGDLILRDVGDLAFARDDSDGPTSPRTLEDQLGPVIRVKSTGYPSSVQHILNALRPGYCVHGMVGESEESGQLEFAADETCEIVEAVPVEFVIDTEYIPEFADSIWQDDLVEEEIGEQIPHIRRTLHSDDGPAADVYVFPKGIRNEQGIPLIAAMQRGMTHHLEKFTTNFTGVFTGGVIDVLFIAPTNRPYFAVYCLGGDCLDLSHELRAELELPVIHRGWDADRSQVYDIRYNPLYVRRTTTDSEDILLPVNSDEGKINIEDGTVEGDYFELNPEPNEIVVTVSEGEKSVEVARLRAPSVRVRTSSADSVSNGCSVDDRRELVGESSPDVLSNELSKIDRSRIADIVELQPTSNGELAERWGLSDGSEVYQYLSSILDDYYYRDEDKYLRATDQAEQLVREQ
jgi:hypothetical protein